ncbi:GAF domain-containing protein [Actinomadura viridis]|uniref:OmpR/PhoB-type domain-containing protein n=1 Tax=Actinomadura viridis TaxID=58110 RepID=A0A931GL32_9ACTN|nr:helix-turn-helix domain-containing protein [Actinomadura viridis]MBG6090710.1 hypothetical protein [Actinomadura viridis]
MARALSAVRDAVQRGDDDLPGGRRDASGRLVRRSISESWRRARRAGADPATPCAPRVYERDELAAARARHPLDPHLPMLRDLLRRFTDESEHIMVIADADAHTLWSEGAPAVLREADQVGLVEGFCWSERSVGTNGIGTALVTGSPEYVYGPEHLASSLHGWSCAGAPIRDPDTGCLIGCIDVSGTVEALHPAAVALVGAAARLAEAHLEARMRLRDQLLRDRYGRHLAALRGEPGVLATATGRILAAEPAGWSGRRLYVPVPGGPVALPDGRWAMAEPLGEVFLLRPPRGDQGAEPAGPGPENAVRRLLALTLLGEEQPAAWLDGRRLPLSLRHAEILALLALHPRGLNGDRLATHLYGCEGSPVTVRAEIHRLRAQFGDIVQAKPYRLGCDVDADFLAVRRLLDTGEVAAAVRLARGELLPRSDAPGIRAERDELSVLLRRQVLDHGGAESLWAYAQVEPGRDDLEVLERLGDLIPSGDPRRDQLTARIGRLLDEEP